ncbi:MAG: FKBP-type peptidyl-prolyl cis-trans isomerase [Burkholderiaceae bacterium]
MNITAPCVVSLTWLLSDAQNALIDELSEPTEFFYGGDDLLPKVEEALAGQEAGFDTHLHLEPENAFGDYDSDLVCFEDRALFPDGVEPGMQFEGLPDGAQTPDMPEDAIYTVTEVYPSHVVLDGNHPLAGLALRMHITVRAVRAATPAEIDARSVNDDGMEMLQVMPAVDRSKMH